MPFSFQKMTLMVEFSLTGDVSVNNGKNLSVVLKEGIYYGHFGDG